MGSEDLHEMLANRKISSTEGGGDRMTSPDHEKCLPPNEEVIRLVASAERGSEHPLAKVRRGYSSYRASPYCSSFDRSPSLPYDAGTDHVGFSPTRQTLVAKSAKGHGGGGGAT